MSFSSVSLESWDWRGWDNRSLLQDGGEPLLVAHKSFGGISLWGEEGRDTAHGQGLR